LRKFASISSPLSHASPNTFNPGSYALITTSTFSTRFETISRPCLLIFPSTSFPLFFLPSLSSYLDRFLLNHSLEICRTHPTPSIRIQEVRSLGRLSLQIDPLFPFFHPYHYRIPLERMDSLYGRRFDWLQHGLDGQV